MCSAPLLLLAQASTFLPQVPDFDVGGVPTAAMGTAVRPAGDVDGDGRDDLLVFAPTAPVAPGVHGQGAVFLHRGTPTGFDPVPAWTIRGDALPPHARADIDASGAGDVNGDGYDDIVVSSSYGFGRVHVFHGGPLGPSAGASAMLEDADWIAEGASQSEFRLGAAVLGPGDVDGDGFDDIVVGCTHHSSQGLVYDGAAFLFTGSPSGLPAAGAQPGGSATSADAAWSTFGGVTHGYLGRSLHALDDIDGDGYADFAVGADGIAGDTQLRGRFVVYRGGAAGPAPGLGGAHWVFGSGAASGSMGEDLAAADFDGDGYVDIVLAWPHSNFQGLEPIQLWRGTPNGFELALHRPMSWLWYEGVGESLAAGDVDGDGNPDLALLSRAYTAPGGPPWAGRARVWRGLGSELGWFDSFSEWEWSPGIQQELHAGIVEFVGDPESDESETLALGMPYSSTAGAAWDGRVVAFSAPGDPLEECALAGPDWTHVGAPDERFGTWTLAGDFDGDGDDDLLVGSSRFAAGQPDLALFRGGASGPETAPSWTHTSAFPSALRGARPAGAGDVNGDGYDDALVLLPGSEYTALHPGGFVPGRALVFHGGPGGLVGPVWTAAPSSAEPLHFALAGTIAGDLDGDGFDDVVLGAEGYDSRYVQSPFVVPGRVHVYRGSALGVHAGVLGDETNAAWTAEHPDALARFGATVRGAGDVDGDGFDDLLVGAPSENVTSSAGPVGALYLFRGGAAGPGGGVAGTPQSADQRLVAGGSTRRIGELYDAGVDVTGDGRPDLVSLEQRAGPDLLVLHAGGAGGFAAGMPVALPPRSSQSFAFALLPDFDGDGDGDLAIGWPDENARDILDGLVEVYRGGAQGLASSPRWRGRGFQLRERGGIRVRGADVDGDGLTDLVSTAIQGWSSNQAERAGRLAVYLGTDRPVAELDSSLVAPGDVVVWRHSGAEPFAPLMLVGVERNGLPIQPRRWRFGRATADADGCAVQLVHIPLTLLPSTFTLESWSREAGGTWGKSRSLELVVQ